MYIILKYILTHLENSNIITYLNPGFRSGYSCETQLLTIVHHLPTNHDFGTQIGMGILDFSKAFDTVPHKKLLHKLELYDVTGSIYRWLGDFLTDRGMKVVTEGDESTPLQLSPVFPRSPS